MAYGNYSNEIEVFKEELEENMAYIKSHLTYVMDEDFAASLCSFYEDRGYLTEKQLWKALQFWREAKDNAPVNEELTGKPVIKK